MLHERAVLNSGPLIALSLIGQLDLPGKLFKEFWIPDAVYHEVAVAGIGKPGAVDLSAPFLRERVIDTPRPDPLLVAELDTGEAAVIALAWAKSPCLAIIDEKRGRKIAKQVYGLPVKGTVGLLVDAKRRGLLHDLPTALMELKLAGYYLSDALIHAACQAANTA